MNVASASASQAVINPGQVESLQASIVSNVNLSGIIAEIRVVDANNQVIDYGLVSGVKLAANTPYSFNHSFVSSSSTALGTYTVVVGVWSSTWAKTYFYGATGASFQVQAPVSTVQPSVSVSGVSVSAASVTAGQTEAISASINSNVNISNALISIRVVDANRNIIDSNTFNANLAANQAYAASFNFVPSATLAAGTYGIEIGVWSSDWTTTYIYDQTPDTFQVAVAASADGTTVPPASQINDASGGIWTLSGGVVYLNGGAAGYSANVTLLLYYGGKVYQENSAGGFWYWDGSTWVASSDPRVSASPSPSPTATSTPVSAAVSVGSTTVSAASVSVGQTEVINSSVTSNTNITGAIVSIRVVDANRNIIDSSTINANLVANQSYPISFNYVPASTVASGTYGVEIGVWSSDWSITYIYDQTQLTFQVSGGATPAPSPSPTATVTPSPTPSPSPTGVYTPVLNYLPPVTMSQGGFTVSGQVTQSTMSLGQIQYGKISVTSANAVTGVLIQFKFVNSAGTQLILKQLSGDFAAGQTKTMEMPYAFRLDDPAGTYSIAVMVSDANYTPYFYSTGIPIFQVNSAGYVAPAPVTSMPANNLSMISTDGFLYAGSYFVDNNMWGIAGLTAGTYNESAGIGPIASDGSVSARWNWLFPTPSPAGAGEVKAYPAVGIGQKPGQANTPNSGMPKLVSSVTSVPTSWDTQAMYTGIGHLSYDIWLTKDANQYSCFDCTPKTHEIMISVDNFGGYAVSNPQWYWGATIIDGITYRVWKADNFGGGWRFIVLQMVNPVHVTTGSLDFKHVLDYLQSQGLITGQEYLSSIEFGNEMVQGTGDVLIKSFKAQVK